MPSAARGGPRAAAPGTSSVRTGPCRSRIGGGILEGADHPGDVAQRRALEPSLADAPAGLSLQVQDDEVLAGVEHLPQMVVTVDPEPRHRELAVHHRARLPEQRLFQRHHGARVLARRLGQGIQPAAQEVERGPGVDPERLVDRAAVVTGEELGRKDRILASATRAPDGTPRCGGPAAGPGAGTRPPSPPERRAARAGRARGASPGSAPPRSAASATPRRAPDSGSAR